jgi:hypothetical protein
MPASPALERLIERLATHSRVALQRCQFGLCSDLQQAIDTIRVLDEDRKNASQQTHPQSQHY